MNLLLQEAAFNESIGSYRRMLWAVVLGLVPFKDGNSWCVRYGDDLQVGIASFGKTPEEAMINFDTVMRGDRVR